MRFTNYKKVTSYDLSRELQKECDFSAYQRQKIEDWIDCRYSILEFEKNKNKVPVLLRLTVPLFSVCTILCFCIMPLKWIFTGNRYFKHEGFIAKSMRTWARKIKFY